MANHTNPIAEVPAPQPGSYKHLFGNEQDSDVEILLGDTRLPAHSAVLKPQSRYFQIALSRNFMESTTRVFKFTDGSLQAYWRVFYYMYHGHYNDEPEVTLDSPEDDDLVKDLRVYQKADYLMVEDLRGISFNLFEAELNERRRRSLSTRELVLCAREAYASIAQHDRALRRRVARLVRPWFSGTGMVQELQEVLDDVEDLAADVARSPAPGGGG